VRPPARAAEDEVRLDRKPIERGREQGEGEAVMSTKKAHAIERRCVDGPLAERGERPIGIEERGVETGLGKGL